MESSTYVWGTWCYCSPNFSLRNHWRWHEMPQLHWRSKLYCRTPTLCQRGSRLCAASYYATFYINSNKTSVQTHPTRSMNEIKFKYDSKALDYVRAQGWDSMTGTEKQWTNKYELNKGISDQTKVCTRNVLSWLPGERWATDCHTDI